MKLRAPAKTINMCIRLEPNVKNVLRDLAEKRGMDLSKLVRAVLTNWVKPDTFSL